MNAEELRARLVAFSGRQGIDDPAPSEVLAAPVRSDDAVDLADADLVPAAVLVPIVLGPAPGVLLTKRTSHLAKHPGQVSFPGGRMDPDDAHPEAAALREAEEELGILPAAVAVVGTLSPVPTLVSNYLITPVIGRAIARPAFTPSPGEVAEVIELPLAGLRDPAIYRCAWRETPGGRQPMHTFQYGPHNIWGATARILHLFLEITRE